MQPASTDMTLEHPIPMEMGPLKESKMPYPKAVLFLLSHKFFDRFFMQSLRSMLVLYLISQIGFTEKGASIIYHSSSSLIFMMGIMCAIISDSWLGNFRTIMYMNVLSLISTIVFVLYVAEQLGLPCRAGLTVISLMLFSCAHGCMKPCAIAFGAEQFKLPEQKSQMERYFGKFYFVVKLASVFACFVLPILRSDISSLNPADGYLLSFGVALAVTATSVFIFMAGSPFYTKVKSKENMLVLVIKCIGSAIAGKWRHVSKPETNTHWLDYASPTYSRDLVQDAKTFLNMVLVLLPISMYWALNEQTASIFPLQATRLNGSLGFYTIKPDQLQLVMQLLVVMLLPLFEYVLYPMLAKVGIRTPFQKIALAGWLSVAAYIVAGGLDIHVSKSETSAVHMAWMLPQYVMLASTEAIIGVTGMAFTNINAPASLKTVMQATWLSTHAMGNVVNVTVFSVSQFSNKAVLFYTFAVLTVVDTILFIFLSRRFQIIKPEAKVSN